MTDRAAAPASEQTQRLIAALYDIAMYGDRGNPKGLRQSIAGTIAGLASAPQAVRMPLTEDEIRAAVNGCGLGFTGPDIDVARAVERAHGIVPLAPQDTGERE